MFNWVREVKLAVFHREFEMAWLTTPVSYDLTVSAVDDDLGMYLAGGEL